MNTSPPQLVLMPGLDGTGILFERFIASLSGRVSTLSLDYPKSRFATYAELEELVVPLLPCNKPFVLLAESYSTPLALKIAASSPPGLKGLVLCAGFVSSPVNDPLRFLVSLLSPSLFHISLPDWVIRLFLTGWRADPVLRNSVCAAIHAVDTIVLQKRLEEVLNCKEVEALQRVTCPILYLQALQDRLVSSSACSAIAQVNPRVHIVRIPGPHLLLQREPEACIAKIVTFLEERCRYV